MTKTSLTPFDKEIQNLFNQAAEKEQTLKLSIEEPTEEKSERVAVIRTSDRIAFKACRRKWAFSSHLRGNIEPIQSPAPLWFGLGFHFALEDYHGFKLFKSPMQAFDEFIRATRSYRPQAVPTEWEELREMGISMLEYYLKWEERRELSILPTYYHNGEPQVEVNFRVEIPIDPKILERYGFDKAVYSGTIDQVVYDKETEMIWLKDHKTAKIFNSFHFQMDPQISAYCWAASCMYDKPIGGMIYSQHLKRHIKPIKPLKSGSLSIAANQVTTSIHYGEGLKAIYGSISKASEKERAFLNNLLATETERKDRYISQEFIPRSLHTQQAEGVKILMETEDMLNPDIPLYPNPGMQCGMYCAFNGVCVSMDDGSDWEATLLEGYRQRDNVYDKWRDHIIIPGTKKDEFAHLQELYSDN